MRRFISRKRQRLRQRQQQRIRQNLKAAGNTALAWQVGVAMAAETFL